MFPLIIEQFLTIAVGAADSMMVASAGEAAVSGVSLVDGVNVLILQVLAALATGGAIICSQYIGRRRPDQACEAANQLMLATVCIAVLIMAAMLIGGRGLLRLIFGQTEQDVMDQAVLYCSIIVITYPFMGLYNSSAALFRSMGNSRISMLVSLIMNLINIAGNALLIFVLKMGVAGAALATLFSRIVGAGMLTVMIRNPKHLVHLHDLRHLRPDFPIIKKILYIGIPTGFENGIFQIGKLLVLSLVATFGTSSIMANSVGSTLSSFIIIPGVAVSLTLVTIVGQCMGAGRLDEARYYTNRLLLVSGCAVTAVAGLLVLARGFLLGLYNMSPAAYEIADNMILIQLFFCPLWPLSFNLPNVLRSAGDVAFPMIVSIASVALARVGTSYLLGLAFHMGVYGVWLAMFVDWFVRAVFFVVRYRGGKWHRHRLI